jgi:hypothetical protein
MVNKKMFLVIAIFAIIEITTFAFEFTTIEAQSRNTSSPVNITEVESASLVVKNFEFDPPILTLTNSAKITFDFQDSFHSVMTTNASMADPININGGEVSDPIPVGEKREVTIVGQPGGVIEFQCGIHGPSMSGTIRIKEGTMAEVGSDMLLLSLEDWGGDFPTRQDRIYNSYSGVLTVSSNDIERISIDKSDSQIKDLKSSITANDFFSLNNEYGNPSDCCDIVHHSMSISMGNSDGSHDSKTVYWNDAADFPGALTKIASEIKGLK